MFGQHLDEHGLYSKDGYVTQLDLEYDKAARTSFSFITPGPYDA